MWLLPCKMPKKNPTPKKGKSSKSPAKKGPGINEDSQRKDATRKATPQKTNMAESLPPRSPRSPRRIPTPNLFDRLADIQDKIDYMNQMDKNNDDGGGIAHLDLNRPLSPIRRRSRSRSRSVSRVCDSPLPGRSNTLPPRGRKDKKSPEKGQKRKAVSSSSSADSSSSSSGSSSPSPVRKHKKSKSKSRGRSAKKSKHGRHGKRTKKSKKSRKHVSNSSDSDDSPSPVRRPKPQIGKGKKGKTDKGKSGRRREVTPDSTSSDSSSSDDSDSGDYTDTDAEFERLTARAMSEVSARDNKAQREKLAREKLLKSIKEKEDQNQFKNQEDISHELNDLTPEQRQAIAEDRYDNNFAKVVKAAQDKFEEPLQRSGPINEGYAKIINSALR